MIVEIGQRVRVFYDDEPDEDYIGYIVSLNQQIIAEKRVFPIAVHCPGQVKAGYIKDVIFCKEEHIIEILGG